MTKTKSQLRAEAVERLKNCRYETWSDSVCAALGWGHEPHLGNEVGLALIDLLQDDDCGPCYTCSRLAELISENGQLRAKLDEERTLDDELLDKYLKRGEEIADLKERVEELETENAPQPYIVVDGERKWVEADSREKLEADAGELTADYASSGGVCDALYCGIIDLLDRQAAITERQCLELGAAVQNQRDKSIAELQAKLDELTAENADLRGKLLEVATIAAWPLADLDGTSVVDIEGNVL